MTGRLRKEVGSGWGALLASATIRRSRYTRNAIYHHATPRPHTIRNHTTPAHHNASQGSHSPGHEHHNTATLHQATPGSHHTPCRGNEKQVTPSRPDKPQNTTSSHQETAPHHPPRPAHHSTKRHTMKSKLCFSMR